METLLLHPTLLKFAHSFLGNLRTHFYVGVIFLLQKLVQSLLRSESNLSDRKSDWTSI